MRKGDSLCPWNAKNVLCKFFGVPYSITKHCTCFIVRETEAAEMEAGYPESLQVRLHSAEVGSAQWAGEP